MPDQIMRWVTSHPKWTLALLTLAALAPFLGKPFHIDDPLFLWMARQIHAHPLNPYGFSVNWYGAAEPMWSVTENPPLAGYYLALAGTIFGWSEFALHGAFLLPALAVILGTFRLASRLCPRPLLAAAVTLFAPVFLVSATTVMCDVSMLAFWIWAVVFWLEGTETGRWQKLLAAALLIGFAELTKYFGVALIPLLAAHNLLVRRKLSADLLWFAVPLALLGLYQWVTLALYGHPLFSGAMDYANFAKATLGATRTGKVVTSLTFAGGCFAAASLLLLRLAPRRWLAAAVGAALLTLLFARQFLQHLPSADAGGHWTVALQIVFWMTGGIMIAVLALDECWRRRDAAATLLVLWIFGTFLFAGLCNWTVNARSILPMGPAIGVLVARRLSSEHLRQDLFVLAVGAALAMGVVTADDRLAIAQRDSARQVIAKNEKLTGTLWFEGHWAFQYYLEKAGATALDVKHSRPRAGDRVAIPLNNTSLFDLNPETVTKVETISVPGPAGLTTWSEAAGAGFYASARGPLPFSFGAVPAETVFIYQLNR